MIFRNGIKSITMDDVATQLGISKKTIYQYYEDKNAVINAIAKHELAMQIKEMDETRKTANNSIDEIFKTMSCLSRTFIKFSSTKFMIFFSLKS